MTITITIPSIREEIARIENNRRFRNDYKARLEEARRQRGKARVRYAETRWASDRARLEVDAWTDYVEYLENLLY